MSARWEGQALLEPISAAQPCGENLEGTSVLAAFDALRLFGQPTPPDTPPAPAEPGKQVEKPKAPTDWVGIRADALDALKKSKDLRLLACLATALLRTDGLPAFAQTLTIASHWLETYWPQVYPLIDEDAVIRRNTLNCLADPMAVVEKVWRTPLVSSRQHGTFTLRDVEMASGPAKDAIKAAFGETPLEELTALDESVTSAIAAMNGIDARMRSEGGSELALEFGPLSTQFAKLNRLFHEHLAARQDGSGAGQAGQGQGGSVAPGAYVGGAIKSREEAVRALEAVADFFRGNEPSSPIPMIVDRAKRLVAKNFLEVLADIAPDAVSGARSAGGLKD